MKLRLLLLFFSIFYFNLNLAAQWVDLKFKHITPKNGLSQSTVTCILRDSRGYMWFGTENGLNKYDGYKITIYRKDKNNPKGINSNRITGLLEDKEGNVWITTLDGGLNKYERETESFKAYVNDESNPQSISNNGALSIIQDKEGFLWISTYWGLNKFDYKKGIFTRFYNDPADTTSLIENSISSLLEDSKGNLWIGTINKGLDLFDRKTNTFKHFQHDPGNKKSISNNVIKAIFEDNKGRLWIGTDLGINLFDYKNQNFKCYSESSDTFTLRHNRIMAISQDPLGNLWVGTGTGGVNIFDFKKNQTLSTTVYENNPKSINSASIYSLYKDVDNNMWIGTANGGVNWVDWQEKKFKHFKRNPLDESTVGNNYISSFAQDKNNVIWVAQGVGLDIYNPENGTFFHFSKGIKDSYTTTGSFLAGPGLFVDRENNIWIGTWGKGVTRLASDRVNYTRFEYDEKNPKSISSNYIKDFEEDKDGNIWIATSGAGLCKYDVKSNSFKYIKHDPTDTTSIGTNYIGCLFIDSRGQLLIGTEGGGLNIYNKKTDNFKRFLPNANDIESISSPVITSIIEDNKKRIWIGTFNGLNLFDPKTGKFITYNEKEGLPGNSVRSIQEDDHGNLWLSTNNGVSKFNPEKMTFRNYTPEDGLQGLEFNSTSLRSKSGEIFFSSSNGLNVFHPDSIKDNTVIPKVNLTNFQIFNKDVVIGAADSPLKHSINETKEVTLSYLQSVFSIEFAALSFSSPEKNQYAYKMEGFETDWNVVGNKRSATYTNLHPGQYTFKVKASNSDGIWNEGGVSLSILITPPYWETWWFRLFIALSLIGGAYTFYRRRINKINNQKLLLEHQVKSRTYELLEANNQLSEQKEEIFAQRDKLELLYTDIKDSIRAAEGLQQSILPSLNYIQQHLPESFIFFKPKDVVSGDFYWFQLIDDNILLASVDCTGHGVSGAIMSINGYHLLNNSLLSIKNLSASVILDSLNEGIIKERIRDVENEVQDGMDLALCIINKSTKKLQFSGAVNPLYILRNGKIIQIRGDGSPIGLTLNGSDINYIRKYKNHEVELQSGDMVYIFSDGYADQIGGEDCSKFKYPRFRQLLEKIGDKSMQEQLAALEANIVDYMGENDQLDDMLVIGFRIS